MIRRPPRSTLSSSSAASDVYKRQYQRRVRGSHLRPMAQLMEVVPTEVPADFNTLWSNAIRADEFLEGAPGPHMGMGAEPTAREDRIANAGHCSANAGYGHENSSAGDPDKGSLCGFPQDLLIRQILAHLPPKPLLNATMVCHEWSWLCSQDMLWKNLYLNVKFWRIWYDDPTDWRQEFLWRHKQELVSERNEEPEGATLGEGEMPHWHRLWHGGGDDLSEGIPTVKVTQGGMAEDAGVAPLGAFAEESEVFSSIQEAVDSVEAGTRIIVGPGTYSEETISVDKEGIEIVGCGGQADRVIVNANMQLLGSTMRLANLNIRTQPNLNDEGSVRIAEGSGANIEDCDIRGSVILSDGSDGLVRNNRIHSGFQNGVSVEGATGTIVNNDVTGHKMCGMVLKGDADPVVRNNTFSGNDLAGVVIGGDATGTFEGNQAIQNRHYGMAVGASAEPMIRGNLCKENHLGGLLASGHSAGLIENNEVSDNTGHGMVLAGSNTSVATGNVFHNNSEAGMALCGDSRASVEDNRIYKNGGAGAIIQDAATPVMRRNRLKTNDGEGIVVLDNAGGTIENNQVSNNGAAGVVLNENSNPTVRSNTVSNNRGYGIMARDHSQASIVQNKVQGNEMTGVSIHDQAQIRVTENLVSHNHSAGITLSDQADSVVEKNHVTANALAGIQVSGDNILLRDNRVSRNAHVGCLVTSSCKNVVIADNTFQHNTVSEVLIQDQANPTILNNSFVPFGEERASGEPPLPVSLEHPPKVEHRLAVSLENDSIGTVGVGRAGMLAVHTAAIDGKLCLYAVNRASSAVTLTFELWNDGAGNGTKKVMAVKVLQCTPEEPVQMLMNEFGIAVPCDVTCYAPRQGVPHDFEPEQLQVYGFCLVPDTSDAEHGWKKTAVTPSSKTVTESFHDVNLSRYERNTGCQMVLDDSMSE
eukprot:TRINITY_DN11944_c0_g1_i4.p1 TRINITY_DN11944_c0_g1~~TRINITY_DN11944_c0_g1_i4.p1  ORF type:complete len:926 (-),score=208.82 TRINITY_DN11944_c0_g1_i4:264-3041(-)